MCVSGNERTREELLTEMSELRARLQESEKTLSSIRSFAVQIEFLREKEKTQIARELYDELGQALVALKMDIGWLMDKCKDQGPLAEKTTGMSEIVDSTIQKIRRISSELRPGVLDDLGICAAMEWLAEDVQKNTGIQCEVTFSPSEIILDRARATTIFRVFEAAMTNIVFHANAKSVEACLRQEDDRLFLTIADDGKGITEEQQFAPGSLGITGIRENVLSWGGNVKISGIDGKGTRLVASIPSGDNAKRRTTLSY